MKAILYMLVNEYDFTWKVVYSDKSSKTYGLDTMPAKLIRQKWRKTTTSDPKVYTLFPTI